MKTQASNHIGSPEIKELTLEESISIHPDAVYVEIFNLGFYGIITSVHNSANTMQVGMTPRQTEKALQKATWLRDTGRAVQLRGYRYVTTLQAINEANANEGEWYTPTAPDYGSNFL